MHLGALALFLALLAPPFAEAQQAAKVYRIGVLVLAPLSARPQQWEAFRLDCASTAASKGRTS